MSKKQKRMLARIAAAALLFAAAHVIQSYLSCTLYNILMKYIDVVSFIILSRFLCYVFTILLLPII